MQSVFLGVYSPHRKEDLLEFANYYEDLEEYEFEELAKNWRSSDELNRFADLQDKIDLDLDLESCYN